MSRERNLLRVGAALLTAAGMFTSAFTASSDRVGSVVRPQRFEVGPFCLGKDDIYPAFLPGVSGQPILSIFYRDADGVIGRPRVLIAQREGDKEKELGPVRSLDGGPTVISSFYKVDNVGGASRNIRFAVFDAEQGRDAAPLAEKIVESPECD